MRDWADIFADWPKDVSLSYNVSPTQTVPVFTVREGLGMRWGLIPRWFKEVKSKYSTFNARLETVELKPFFKGAWNKSQRCLIPAQGFFEWKKKDRLKQPYFVRSPQEGPLVFAGLWDVWQGEDSTIHSCTIITKPSEGPLTTLHPRMPVLLERRYAQDWFRLSPKESKQLLGEQKVDLTVYKVSSAVNNPRNEGPGLIKEVT